MNSDSRRANENPDHRHIQILADEAVVYAKVLDLDRYPSAHISRALRGIPEGKERDRLFGQIRTELNRRRFKTPQQQRRESDELLRDARKQLMLEDAYKHEGQINPREQDDENEVA